MSNAGEPIPGATPLGIDTSPVLVVGTKLNIEEVKNELINHRTISINTDQAGRAETAKAAFGARTEAQTTQERLVEREQKIQQITELTSASYQREQQKSQELTQRMENLVVKIKGLVGIDDKQVSGLQAEVDAIKKERGELYAQSWAMEIELSGLKQKQTEIPNPRQLLEAYYEKMSTQPLTNEHKRNLLKPEVLASLSDEEYVALWRRLNPYFLAHVTRQGFRDHTGGDIMVDHASGYREYVNGFVDVMKNGRGIFPPLARVGLINRDETTVKSFLSGFFQRFTSADETKEMFGRFLNSHMASAPCYPDITATHLAAQIVSDRYYGGERGNEVFFVYPSDILASQYAFAFNGWEKDFTKPQSETKWNDVFIWTDPNNPGVPVDSGIVFLPGNIPVDPETGSKYASEVKSIDGQERRVMVEDTALVNSFVEWGKKLDDQSLLKKAFLAYKDERNNWTRQDLREDCFKAIDKELQDLGFKADASTVLAEELIREMYWRESFDEEILGEIIKGANAHLKRAGTTVPAKEYWENFFAKNTSLRPKHVQYYDGDPTTAVFEFQQQSGIGKADTSGVDGQLLGFDDNHIIDMGKDPRSNVGYDGLVATANKLIDEHYGVSAATVVGRPVV